MPSLLTRTEALSRLADDVAASAWLLPEDDAVRRYLSMLAALPAEEDAWSEVLTPWLDELRSGRVPPLASAQQLAAIGAVGVAALRAAKDLPPEAPLGRALHAAARWCFFVVRPETR